MSEQRKYRKFTSKKKLEIVVASLRGERSVVEICREHGIAESLLRKWREQALEAAAERFESGQERTLRPAASADRGAGADARQEDLRAGDRRKSLGGLGVSVRVARSRRLVAEGYALATVARVMKISRQALYRTPKPRSVPQRRSPADPVEQAIVAEALANQTDGYRMICAFVRRKLGVPVNRKRVLRV